MASNDPDLARQKLRLEIDKLAAEVRQIEAQLLAGKDWVATLKRKFGVIAVILTVGVGGWGLYTGIWTFLDQRERQYEFNVSKELIELSRQLASDDRIERANAAILLSAFEVDAIPILVENLSVTDKEGLHTDIRKSLALIMKKNNVRKKPGRVLQPLARQMEAVFDEQVRQPRPSVNAILNYVQTLKVLAQGSQHKTSLAATCRIQKRLDEGSTSLIGTDAVALGKALKNSLKSISTSESYECEREIEP